MPTDPIRFKPPSEKIPESKFAEIWAGHFDIPLDRDSHLISVEEFRELYGLSPARTEVDAEDSPRGLNYEPDPGQP